MKQAISIYDLFRKKIQINTIKHVEGYGNYSRLHLTDSKPILTSRTIAKMAGQLPTFVRIHRKHLINPYFIAPNQLLSYRNAKLTLTTDEVLPVSRRRAAELITYLANAGLLTIEYAF